MPDIFAYSDGAYMKRCDVKGNSRNCGCGMRMREEGGKGCSRTMGEEMGPAEIWHSSLCAVCYGWAG